MQCPIKKYSPVHPQHKDKTHITTRTAAVPDVFDSGRNVGALGPGRRVRFPVSGAGAARRHFPGT